VGTFRLPHRPETRCGTKEGKVLMATKASSFAALLALALAALLVATAGIAAEVHEPDIPRMSIDELHGRLGDGTLTIYDVRIGGDWRESKSKIIGARRGDPYDVGRWSGELPKDGAMVLYCS